MAVIPRLPCCQWRHIYEANIRDQPLVKLDGKMNNGAAKPGKLECRRLPAYGHPFPSLRDGIYHAAWFSNAPERHGLFYAHSETRARFFPAAEFR